MTNEMKSAVGESGDYSTMGTSTGRTTTDELAKKIAEKLAERCWLSSVDTPSEIIARVLREHGIDDPVEQHKDAGALAEKIAHEIFWNDDAEKKVWKPVIERELLAHLFGGDLLDRHKRANAIIKDFASLLNNYIAAEIAANRWEE